MVAVDLSAVARRLRGAANHRRGGDAEDVVGHRLRGLGFLCVQRIQTGWRVQRKGGRIVGASPIAKVMGDFTGIEPKTGRFMICEVKSRRSKTLPLHAFALHQRCALDAVVQAKGIAFVAWVSTYGVAVMNWDQLRLVLEPRAPMTWDAALNMQTTSWIAPMFGDDRT